MCLFKISNKERAPTLPFEVVSSESLKSVFLQNHNNSGYFRLTIINQTVK